jgi:hypothetical protein
VLDEKGNPIPSSYYTKDLIRNEVYLHSIYQGLPIKIQYYINPQLAKSLIAKRDSSLIVFNNQQIDEFHQINPQKNLQKMIFLKG